MVPNVGRHRDRRSGTPRPSGTGPAHPDDSRSGRGGVVAQPTGRQLDEPAGPPQV